ncbi:MAG: serine protease [Chloroflexi bacterium]|nr:serine protease [Chloroflexota bacterium]
MPEILRRVLLAVAAAIMLAGFGSSGVAAQEAGGEAEVRITARRLADGRTEFALQERALGESWGERRLPRSRFFPASPGVGRWLSSSVLTIDVSTLAMLSAEGAASVEVRIAARRLADGRTEFALQERALGESWGERRLPRSRFFPASPGVGRWLSSSPLTVGRTGTERRVPEPCVATASAARVEAATFQVQTATGSIGTAFYIGSGEWVTNHHVVDDVPSATLVNGPTRLAATVAGSLPDYDLALLRAGPPASGQKLTFVATRPALASELMVVGFPAWVESTPSVTRGVVSKHAPFSAHYPGRAGTVVQVDAPVNPGNSGGPIVDNCGAVIGVATFKYDTTRAGRPVEGINFGVAAETVVDQLGSLRTSTHHVRGSVTATTPPSAALEVTAFCNREANSSFDTCSVAGARGLHNGPIWLFVRGVLDYDNVHYSVDGGEARDYLSLRDVGRGRHTLRVNELRVGGWTGWSPPYTFSITGAAPLEIRAICNGDWADYDTSDECFAAGSGGILAESIPVIWTIGVSEWDNLQYSIDDGPPIPYSDLDLRGLSKGFHTIRVSEQQAAGWTGWSEPYAFTITGAAPIAITAICNWEADQTSDECRAAAASGMLADDSPAIWRLGTLQTEHVRYSIDGGPAVAWEDFTLRHLTPGRYHVRLSEQQPAGWTGWSEPYWFTIRGAAPLEIVAFCDHPGDGATSEQCDAAAVTRGGRHWLWWRGVVDSANLQVSVDGGAAVAWSNLSLWALPRGRHNIRIAEQQPAGWTGWSEPYWFTIRE